MRRSWLWLFVVLSVAYSGIPLAAQAESDSGNVTTAKDGSVLPVPLNSLGEVTNAHAENHDDEHHEGHKHDHRHCKRKHHEGHKHDHRHCKRKHHEGHGHGPKHDHKKHEGKHPGCEHGNSCGKNHSSDEGEDCDDVVPLSIGIDTPLDGALLADPAVTVTGTVLGIDPMSVLVNGVTATVTGDAYSASLALNEGLNVITAEASDASGVASSTVTVSVDTTPPLVAVDAPADGSFTELSQATVSGTASDASPITSVAVNGNPLTLTNGAFSATLALQLGANVFTVQAEDAAGNVGSAAVTVTRVEPKPLTVAIALPQAGAIVVTDTVVVVGSVNHPTATVSVNGIEATVTGSQFVLNGLPVGYYTNPIQVIATDGSETASDSVSIIRVAQAPPDPPVDPTTVAPQVDPTVSTDIYDATSFLYSGSDPIQMVPDPNIFDPNYVSILRGRVLARGGAPLGGVVVSARGVPAYGYTVTRADGDFDFAVNGGTTIVLDYKHPAYLSAQRKEAVGWREYTWYPDTVLVPLDPVVTTVSLGMGTVEVAQGSVVADGDGQRQATLIFQAGTSASLRFPDGTAQAIDTLSVRATEYTVGSEGRASMPGELPRFSGYTYAVEFSVDEAILAGADTVQFSQPVPFYVDNFLNFPVGMAVPLGYYDFESAAWVAADNGRVIGILSVAGGMATLDADGDGLADDAAQLAALGINAEELQQLALLYQPGTSLWRSQITHLTPWDCNWPYGPPGDAEVPPPPSDSGDPENDDPDTDSPCTEGGSIIECQNQVLRENIGLVGVPSSLHYSSARTKGRQANRTRNIRLSGGTLPASVKRIDLQVFVAGQRFEKSFPAAPNQIENFSWDGLDVYGRTVQGAVEAQINVSYVYTAQYMAPAAFPRAFGLLATSGSSAVGNRGRQEIKVSRSMTTMLRGWLSKGEGLGGWSLTAHHSLDPVGSVLWKGDGSYRKVNMVGGRHVAGNGVAGNAGDGGPATDAQVDPRSLAVGPEGKLFIGSFSNIRVVDELGTIRVAFDETCSGSFCFKYAGLAFGPDGSLYAVNDHPFSTNTGDQIFKINSNGNLSMIPAETNMVSGIAVDEDGGIYYARKDPYQVVDGKTKVRYRRPDGTVITVAGGGALDPGSANLATDAHWPGGVNDKLWPRLAPNRDLYLADSRRVYRVYEDGRLETIAGTGAIGDGGDGIPATAAPLNIKSFTIGPNGLMYIGAGDGSTLSRTAIYVVYPDGIIRRFHLTDGEVNALAVSRTGSVYYSEYHRVVNASYRVVKALEGLATDAVNGEIVYRVPAASGSEIYVFDYDGRHLRTENAFTGAVIYSFGYDESGRLFSVEDYDGDVTTIERNNAGDPTAVVGPYGARTALSLDTNGDLVSVTNPANESYQLAYDISGLLTGYTRPSGDASTFQYDEDGRLLLDEDAAGGWKALSREELEGGGYAVTTTTAEGRINRKYLEKRLGGVEYSENTNAAGLSTVAIREANGSESVTTPAGDHSEVIMVPDPRLGVLAPYVATRSVETPSGILKLASQTREVTRDPGTGALLTQVDTATENGVTSKQTYDAASNSFTYESGEGRVVATSFDPAGRLLQSEVDGFYPVTYGYDARGRLEMVSQGPAGNERLTIFTYDPATGYLHTVTDPANRVTEYGYDAAGRVNLKILPDLRSVSFGHDLNGNLERVRPPGRLDHLYGFDTVDLFEEYVPPAVSSNDPSTSYAYNLDKQLDYVSRPDAKYVAPVYDGAGRIWSLNTPRGSYDYAYNPTTGKMESITAPGDGGTVAFSYDGSLMTGMTWSGVVSGSVSVAYDNFFRVSSQSVNGGWAVPYEYDGDGLLINAGLLALYRDLANGWLDGTTLGSVTTSQVPNGYGELESDSASYGGATLYSNNYVRDNLGRIDLKTETIQGITTVYDYGYDLAGRLDTISINGVLVKDYAYDSNGNRLAERKDQGGAPIASYDAQDRLLQYKGVSYTYNENGDLVTRLDTATSELTGYEYDVLGNLVGVDLPDGRRIDYVIDGQNRRIGKKVDGALVQGFLYGDLLKPVAELDGSGNVVSRFVYGSKPTVPDYMIRAGQTYRILSDHLGSPRLVVDATSGAVAQRIDYDEFGNILQDSNPGFQPFGFAGGLYDADTHLLRFGARDYDAVIGRWTNKDPIGLSGGMNVYGYVLNDPVNWVDPEGLYWFRQDWQAPGVVGRRGTPVPPGGPVSEFIEKNVPSGYTFGELHDSLVGWATSQGVPDWLANIPSMSLALQLARYVELLRTLGLLDQPAPPLQPCSGGASGSW